MNNVPFFYVLSFFKKGDTIQGGDIIQGRTLFKEIRYTVRPRDTRPQAAQTSQVNVFELGPKKFEMNEFM